jgi:histidine triad (HIT) family protein
MADCLFCKIGSHEIAAEIVYEDEKTMAFLDVQPRSPGHTMVIPKIHRETILDLKDEELGPVFLTVKKVADILKSALKTDGFTIGINHGRVSGQVVEHLHIHLIPRFKNDGGHSIHSVVNNPPKESLKELAEKIRTYAWW